MSTAHGDDVIAETLEAACAAFAAAAAA